MSPNREIFQTQLKWFAREIKAQSILLIDENSIILSDFSLNEMTGKVSEMSAPHFQNLFRTFTEFKLLKQNNAIWHMDDDIIVFYQLSIGKMSLFLFCMMKERDDVIKEIEKILPEFKDRTQGLIESYL